MDKGEEIKPPVITRRQFVGLLLTTIGALAVETNRSIKQAGNIVRLGEDLGIIERGNYVERTAILNELVEDVVWHPFDSHRKKILAAWLKFNAAEIYAGTYNWPITESVIRHFLYGRGKDKNITSDYMKALEAANPPELSGKTPDQKISNKVQNMANHELYRPKDIPSARPVSLNINKFQLKEARSKPGQLLFNEAIVAPFSGINDFIYSLNSHTLRIRGLIARTNHFKSSEPEKYANYWEVTVENPRIDVVDYFDWSNKHDITEGGSLNSFIVQFLKTVGVNDPQQVLDHLPDLLQSGLSKAKVKLTDKEGYLLSQSPYAKAFQVKANFDLKTPLTLKIADNLLGKKV